MNEFDLFLLAIIGVLLIIGTASKVIHYHSYKWLENHGYIRKVRQPKI